MKKFSLVFSALALGAAAPTMAHHHTASTSTIVDTAVAAEQFSTLVAAVQAAELASTLAGPGPFTVFAPTNAAFEALPAGTVEMLLQPENRPALQSVLTYHVVAGNVSAADLIGLIEANGGSATVTTVQGGALTATLDSGNVVLTDERDRSSTVTAVDVAASNGVIHVIDTVVLPN